MTILHPRLTADELAAAVAAVEAQVAAQGGEMISTDVWGRRRLAYPINGSMDGNYVLMTLRLPAPGASPLEAWLIISEPVLRHLLIRGIIPYQGRGRDDDRDRDRDRDDRDDRRDDRDDHADRDRDDRDHVAPVAVLDRADAPEEEPAAAATEDERSGE
ncbi:MAG: 30S ribosomal protein S6 [Dehalococcoidia bacterium]|nr:30S ribosomal protein S6 [Dehalococcoidia bacterium]